MTRLQEIVEFEVRVARGDNSHRSMHASLRSLSERLPLLLQDVPMDRERAVKMVSIALLSSRLEQSGTVCINFGWGQIIVNIWGVWP